MFALDFGARPWDTTADVESGGARPYQQGRRVFGEVTRHNYQLTTSRRATNYIESPAGTSCLPCVDPDALVFRAISGKSTEGSSISHPERSQPGASLATLLA